MANPTGFRHFILYGVYCQQFINKMLYIPTWNGIQIAFYYLINEIYQTK